jgi:polysaccharide export outer membrane protein
MKRLICAASAASLLFGCAPIGAYVWADEYREPPAPQEHSYEISPGDTIQVRVFNQDQLSTRGRVRADGKFTMPLLNDVDAAGLTTVALAQKLEGALKTLIKAPSVTVSLEETKPQIYVSGEVVKPGPYPLESAPGVLQAIVNAGGLGPQATPDRIFVLRQASPPVRIRFSYEALVHLLGQAASFRLRPGDVVVVE